MTANTQIDITNNLSSVIEQVWMPEFSPIANEERVATRGFMSPQGVKKIGRTLNMSKVGTVTAQTMAITDDAFRSALTYDDTNQANVSALAVRIYCGVQIPVYVESQLLRFQDFLDKYKSQLIKSLVAKIDSDGAALANQIVTNVIGGAGQDITESLLTAGIAKLALSAKEYFSPGKNRGFLTVYPLQIDNILQIPSIVNAYIRGDEANPIVKGWVWDAYNLDMAESGNVYTSGGVAYNFLHIPQAFVLGYNQEPTPIPDQDNGLARVVLATAEYAVKPFFENYAVLIQTQTV